RAIAVLVVLVHAEAVPAQRLRILQLVEVLVVERLALLGIVEAVGQRDPRRRLVVLHDVRHQMKVVELHRASPVERQKSTTASATACGSSRCGTSPDSA